MTSSPDGNLTLDGASIDLAGLESVALRRRPVALDPAAREAVVAAAGWWTTPWRTGRSSTASTPASATSPTW